MITAARGRAQRSVRERGSQVAEELLHAGELEIRPTKYSCSPVGAPCRSRCASSSCSWPWPAGSAAYLARRSSTRRSGAAQLSTGTARSTCTCASCASSSTQALPDRTRSSTPIRLRLPLPARAFTAIFTTRAHQPVTGCAMWRCEPRRSLNAIERKVDDRHSRNRPTAGRLCALPPRRGRVWQQQLVQHSGMRAARSPARAAQRRHDQRRRLDVRGARLPTVGAELKDKRHRRSTTRRSARAPASPQLTPNTVDFGALRPAAEADDEASGRQEGRPAVQIPIVLRRDHRLLQPARRQDRPEARRRRRSPTSSSARSRSGTTRRSPQLNPGVKLPSTDDHGRPPLGRVGHDGRLHDLPVGLQPGLEEQVGADKTSSGRPARAPRATTASPPPSSRPTARSATSSRPTRCRTTSPTAASRTRRATSSRRRSTSTSAAGDGLKVPADLGINAINAPGAEAYPIASADVHRSSTRTSARPASERGRRAGRWRRS